MIGWLFFACTGGLPDSGDTAPTDVGDAPLPEHAIHPLDDTLRLDHIQAKGTHNSYHLAPDPSIPDWDYSHPPLPEQLDTWGVRQFELDLHLDEEGEVLVHHVTTFDEESSCPTLVACLDQLRTWSDAHRGHLPLAVFMEPKDDVDPVKFDADAFARVDAILAESFPDDRRLTPDRLRGDAATLADAVATTGWPTLGDLRSNVMFVWLDGGDARDAYLEGHPDLEGREVFVYGNGGEAAGVVHGLDDPFDEAAIAAALAAGHLVRTRADSVLTPSPERRDQAFAVGAHWISTDWPTDAEPYTVNIPGGTPAGCNPVTAPETCAPTDIEDPERLPTLQE